MKLEDIPSLVVGAILDEAQHLATFESNWRGTYGLPGRRESHLVAAVAAHLRDAGARPILDDSFWRCPDTRCDLAFPISGSSKWAWLEMKTMPFQDATDKIAAVHNDLAKLDRAAGCDSRNLPQALAIVGYDSEPQSLATRFRGMASAHSLDRWQVRLDADGIAVYPIPGEPYTHAVIGEWARPTAAVVQPCNGKCHLRTVALAPRITRPS
jgi:hypothetical protein